MSVSSSLAKLITEKRLEDLPSWTIHEAKRTLINMVGISPVSYTHLTLPTNREV